MRPRGLLVLLLIALSGCQVPPTSSAHPPTIRYGEEACAFCRMLISDARFAAALQEASGQTQRFDDIACLIRYLQEHPALAAPVWVRDYETERWVEAHQAVFILSEDLATSMGSGLAAVETEAAAARIARDLRGRLLHFEELPSVVAVLPVGASAARRDINGL